MNFTAPTFPAPERHFRIPVPGVRAQARVVHAFDRLAVVPAADLLMLRHAIGSVSPAASGDVDAVLHLVEEELRRRSAVLPPAGQAS